MIGRRTRCAPSPRLRGEGWGEGDSPDIQFVESPPHPAASRPTSPRKRGEVAPSLPRAFAIIALLLAVTTAPALAQTGTLAELAAYQGADRTQRLIEGAKKEGTVSYFTSLVAEDSNPVIEAFKRKYRIDAQFWRASTEAIVQRALNESRAG